MNFELTKEQQMVREMVKDFAKKEIAPHAEHVDQTGEFPIQTFKKMGELADGYSISRRIRRIRRRYDFICLSG